MIKGASLFSSAGIAETYFKEVEIDIVVANELVKKRADLYSYFYPSAKMICGDITKENIYNEVNSSIKSLNCKFLIATPPCQGMSTLGKKEYVKDKRNYLIFYVLDIIDDNDFDYILIENVPKFLKLFFPFEDGLMLLQDILNKKYSDSYYIKLDVLNAADFGVPQSRPRGIIKMWKKNLSWNEPKKEKRITLREAIGDLPSLESGEDSGIKWHYAKPHNEREIVAMKHTAEGKSALKNDLYYPKKPDGTAIKGFHNTYKRMKWDEPCPARAMNNGNMGGHNNVHPGRKKPDGTYSDARVLTLRELFIVSSLPKDLDLPNWCSDNLIRTAIGEAIPPRFSANIVKEIKANEEAPSKMINLKRSKEEKWIFQKNVSSKDLIKSYVKVLEDLHNIEDKQNIQDKLRYLNVYKGRSEKGSLSTMGVRFSQMCFYMFGYKNNDVFMPTQMTSNMLENEQNTSKNMLVSLFSIQYPHPYSKTPDSFSIYAGRLIIKLLTEEKIENKLYIDEFIWFLPFIKNINSSSYNELVESIIEYRKLTYEEKLNLFTSTENYVDIFANCLHECKYYFMRIFEGFNVITLVPDPLHNNGKLFSFKHGKTETYRKDNIGKSSCSGYIKLNSELFDDAKNLINSFSPFETPTSMKDENVFSKQEWITDLYDIEPLKYLAEVMPEEQTKKEIISIVSDMEYASKYGSVDGKQFENSLKPVFELFKEVLNVEIISGAGDTDVLCSVEDTRKLDSTNPTDSIYKINVDGKSRGSSNNMNVKRLVRHLDIHSSKYCIVVAPRFSRGTILDIKGEKVVAITSDSLAKYCSKECLSNKQYTADFTALNEIIENNLGEDISRLVDNLTENRYGLSLAY